LKEEKEKEIAIYVAQIDGFKEEITNLKFHFEKQNAKKAEIEEEKKDLVENLKKINKQTKKKREVLTEIQKLGN